VVRLRDKLNWYERLPLFGQRIAITRAKGQADALASKLTALGAEAIELPTIEIGPAADYAPLDRAIANLASYDWLIFTSVNGVNCFLDRLDRSTADLRALRAKICAIGPATRAAIEALHLKVDLMGKEYVAEGLLEAFRDRDLTGKRVLLPRAAVARDLVPVELTKRGATVEVVEAYRTVIPESAASRAREIFGGAHPPHWITFTSASTVQNFAAAAGVDLLRGVRVASIGPITTKAARDLGIEVTAEAREYTIDGLVDAVLTSAAKGTN
jgi:uroporphyrinogen III methyltransferase/synthase